MTIAAWRRKSEIVDLGPLLLLGAMVLWFTHEMVWGGKVPFFRDLGPVYYPMWFSLAESLKAGEIPLWDRHVAMGFPLLANFQSGVFYPPHLLFLFLPLFGAIRALFVFHYLVAATGAYCLCRRWSYSPSLAMIGAVLFTFGGYTVSLTNLLPFFQSAVWLPWILLAGERCFSSKDSKDFLLLTFLLLVQFLSGAPEIYAMSLGLLFINGLRFKGLEANVTYRRLILLFLGANILVVGLAMVQILPTAELFLQSRAHDTISYQHSARWSFHPLSLVNLFFLEREVLPSAANGLNTFFTENSPYILSLYMGAIALPAICFWFLGSSLKEKTILVALIIVALILAMGGYTRIYFFLYHYAPLFGLIRYPEKLFFLAQALLLYISFRGLSFFLHPSGSASRKPLFALTSICFIMFLVYLFLRFDTVFLVRFISQTTHAPADSALTLSRVSSVFVHMERQIALTLGFLALFFFRIKGGLKPALFNGLLVLLIFFDLSSTHRAYQYLLSPDFVYKNPRVIAVPDPNPHRLFYYPDRSGYSVFNQPSYTDFHSTLYSNLFPNTGIFHGFDYLQDLDSLARWSYVIFAKFADKLAPEELYRLLGTLNVKHINSFHPLAAGDITLLQHFPEYPSWLYQVNRSVPRAYIVSKTIGEKDPIKTLERLSGAEFNPFKEVVLKEPFQIPSREDFQGQATIVDYTNPKVRVQASLNSQGVLVLADSFYPGWRVTVDGREEKILQANFFFRGVLLSEGEHMVEFRYQPLSFTVGLIISVATLCGVFIWAFVYPALTGKKMGFPT
jgi:hypothetical protein